MSWLIVVLGYLIGSIPTAYIAGRLMKRGDIRRMGDGNAGARNAFFELGNKAGISIFVIDAGKGAAAILIAQAAGLSQGAILLSGVAAVIGHNWPVFISFRGGRGEATTIGVLASLMTLPMLIMLVVTLTVLIIKRNVILASAVLFAPLPLVSWLMGVPAFLIGYGVALPCLVGLTHLLRTRHQAQVEVTTD